MRAGMQLGEADKADYILRLAAKRLISDHGAKGM